MPSASGGALDSAASTSLDDAEELAAAHRLQGFVRARSASVSFEEARRAASTIGEAFRQKQHAAKQLAVNDAVDIEVEDMANQLEAELTVHDLDSAVEDMANQLEAEGRRATIEHSELIDQDRSLRQELEDTRAALEASVEERAREAAASESTIAALRAEVAALKAALSATQAQLDAAVDEKVHATLLAAVPPPSALRDESTLAAPPPASLAAAPQPLHTGRAGAAASGAPLPLSTPNSAPSPALGSPVKEEDDVPQWLLDAHDTAFGDPNASTDAFAAPPAAPAAAADGDAASGAPRTSQELLRLLHASEREREQLRHQRDQLAAAPSGAPASSPSDDHLAEHTEAPPTLDIESELFLNAPPLTPKAPAPPAPPVPVPQAPPMAAALAQPRHSPLSPYVPYPQPPQQPPASNVDVAAAAAPVDHTPPKRPGSILRLGGQTPPPQSIAPNGIPPPPLAAAPVPTLAIPPQPSGGAPATPSAPTRSMSSMCSAPPRASIVGPNKAPHQPPTVLLTRSIRWNTKLCPEGHALGAACASSDGRQLWSACVDPNKSPGWQLRLWSVDANGGRPLRAIGVAPGGRSAAGGGLTIQASSDVQCMVAYQGHVYTSGSDGLITRYAELGAGAPSAFELGVSCSISCLEIEPMARAGWAADGSTARGRPALLICGSIGGDVRAAELPLRGGTTVTKNGVSATSLTDKCVVINTGTAGGAGGASRAGVAALTTLSLAGGLPGAAARALIGGGGAGVAVVWSLRDGSGCGARMGSPMHLGAALSSLRAVGKSLVVAGLANGSMLILAGGGGGGGGGGGWQVAKEVVQCHNGPVSTIGLYAPPANADAPSAILFATSGADRMLRVWQWEVSADAAAGAPSAEAQPTIASISGGEAHPINSAQPIRSLTGAHGRAGALFGAAADGTVCFWEALPASAPASNGASAAATPPRPVGMPTPPRPLGATPPRAAETSGTALRSGCAPAFVHRGAPPGQTLPRGRGGRSPPTAHSSWHS